MCWNITRVSLWVLCNVHFVRSTQRTHLHARPFVHGINNLLKLGVCKQKSSGRPLTAEDDVERARASFLHSPKKSTGTAAKGAIDVENNSVEGSAYAGFCYKRF